MVEKDFIPESANERVARSGLFKSALLVKEEKGKIWQKKNLGGEMGRNLGRKEAGSCQDQHKEKFETD